MISTSHNFLFIHLPKTGGNSVQEALKKYSDDFVTHSESHQDGVERFDVINPKYGTSKHSKYFEYQKLIEPEIFKKLKKFTVVRNPWDRCVSRYFFQYAFDQYSQGKAYRDLKEPKLSKSKFIEIIETTPTLESYLIEDKDALSINSIKNLDLQFLRLENLQKEFDELCNRIGLQVVRLNIRNKSKHRRYYNYYDDETISLVANRFAIEIQLMDYRFNF